MPNSVFLTLDEQVADFGMTKQLAANADQSTSNSPRTNPADTISTTMMTSLFGTRKNRIRCVCMTIALLYHHYSGVYGTRAL